MTPRRLRLLDVCCCAGGATRGYQDAGFHVTGVDIVDRPTYCGDDFIHGDALQVITTHGRKFDAIHASFPCQHHSALTKGTNRGKREHPDLVPAGRRALARTGRPFVLENVAGSTVRKDLRLCGEVFGLGVLMHRYFELCGLSIDQPTHPRHRGRVRGWRHGTYHDGPYVAAYGAGGGKATITEMQQAKGIEWTAVREELTEAIPPAYTRFIGQRLAAALTMKEAA